MQIEFIGSTGAGKSTLVNGIIQAGINLGIDAVKAEDFVLNQVRLKKVKSKILRTLCVDILALCACLATWRNNLKLYLFTARILSRLPATVAWFEKLNIARNVLKNIGIYEIIRHRGSSQQIVLVDEGVLHTAHYLFVHVSVELNIDELEAFASLVPLPDAVIYVQQEKTVLIERTITRGHKRIPNVTFDQVESFITRATDTFDRMVKHLVNKNRLIVVANDQDLIILQDKQINPLPVTVLRIIRIGQDAVRAGNHAGFKIAPGIKEVWTQKNLLL